MFSIGRYVKNIQDYHLIVRDFRNRNFGFIFTSLMSGHFRCLCRLGNCVGIFYRSSSQHLCRLRKYNRTILHLFTVIPNLIKLRTIDFGKLFTIIVLKN